MLFAARFVRIVVIAIVPGVSVVPGFAQSNNANAVVGPERTSTTAARDYDPGACPWPPRALLPANLLVAMPFHSIVDTMLQRSATFRRQCARIADAPDLIVRVELTATRLPSGTRARTNIVRQRSLRVATVEIPALDDAVELIAHEIEHVIEQLDGVDLRSHAARTNSSVHALGPDRATFETMRARRVGLTTAHEVRKRHNEGRDEMGIRVGYRSQQRR